MTGAVRTRGPLVAVSLGAVLLAAALAAAFAVAAADFGRSPGSAATEQHIPSKCFDLAYRRASTFCR